MELKYCSHITVLKYLTTAEGVLLWCVVMLGLMNLQLKCANCLDGWYNDCVYGCKLRSCSQVQCRFQLIAAINNK